MVLVCVVGSASACIATHASARAIRVEKLPCIGVCGMGFESDKAISSYA